MGDGRKTKQGRLANKSQLLVDVKWVAFILLVPTTYKYRSPGQRSSLGQRNIYDHLDGLLQATSLGKLRFMVNIILIFHKMCQIDFTPHIRNDSIRCHLVISTSLIMTQSIINYWPKAPSPHNKIESSTGVRGIPKSESVGYLPEGFFFASPIDRKFILFQEKFACQRNSGQDVWEYRLVMSPRLVANAEFHIIYLQRFLFSNKWKARVVRLQNKPVAIYKIRVTTCLSQKRLTPIISTLVEFLSRLITNETALLNVPTADHICILNCHPLFYFHQSLSILPSVGTTTSLACMRF